MATKLTVQENLFVTSQARILGQEGFTLPTSIGASERLSGT